MSAGLLTLMLLLPVSGEIQADDPLRVGIARLTHDHVHWIFQSEARGDIDITGIYEPNRELAARYTEQYGLDSDLFYTELGEMLDAVEPVAVTAFGSVFEHLEVVEAAAPRGVHVMVEKPLAVSVEHALRMQALAEEHDIHLLTNYETTWYASVHAARDRLQDADAFGDIRKMVVRDGHEGPKEIGVSDEFLDWLTDPEMNGGGALIDFGCYGANLITWLMDGAEPTSVTAVTQQIKPDVYPLVDDEATIILTYPRAQGIIQASWNWPYSRKDMDVYTERGAVFAPDGRHLRVRADGDEASLELESREAPYDDPFSYLAGVVGGEIEVADTDLSALPTNVTVVRILDAARRSAAAGRRVDF